VAPSTTLAHMAALPAIVGDNDAVVLDQFAHASLHMATELLGDVPVHLVRHDRLDLYEQMVADLSARHGKVWLITDGLYSMSGAWAPFDQLAGLLERFPRLHLYIDDAHGTGWFGTHGRGGALMHLGHHDRVVVALSLCKAFACAGGALALPGPELKTRIRRCGGPMLFSGPIQPPMLGAAVASAAVHRSSAHAAAQAELLNRIDYARATADRLGVPLASHHRTPIFFIPSDSADESMGRIQRLTERGFFACLSVFPAVPVGRSGVRFIVSLHNELEDIDAFLDAAAAGR
jgi:7-keto-8-aminopelargonate synthetase-like enzyme